jgi:uncharacterized iron-regulated protein
VGRIWDVAGKRFVDEATLVDALASSRHVLLGELHDNADHHLVQARLVAALAARGRAPVLAFEMLDGSQDARLEEALAAPGGPTPDGIAAAVGWEKSGWPAFALYRPILEAGLAGGMPVRAANLPSPLVRRVVREGKDALPPDARALLDAAPPLGEKDLKELKAEMDESHCMEMPAAMLAPMVLAQRARDAHMAARVAAAGKRGSILVTGNQHAREDRGVPAYLPPAERAAVASVAIAEVVKGWKTPERYAESYGDPLPFDYLVFTPGFAREDPCEKLREQLKKKREKAPAPAPAPPPAPPAAPAPPPA